MSTVSITSRVARGTTRVAAAVSHVTLCVTLCVALASCAPSASPSGERITDWRTSAQQSYRLGRLSARVIDASDAANVAAATSSPSRAPALTGPRRIPSAADARGGLVIVPSDYDPARPLPLLLLLHGAGGSAERIMRTLAPALDSARMIVVVPDSRGVTWDFIRGPFGLDVAFIDSVLHDAFARYRVDRTRVTIAGFSDGASYALSLGLSNGDLFSRVAAFSPGMAGVVATHGRPAVFVSHGARDPILSFERTSHGIVPQLRAAGYDVTFREFDGGHEVPAAVARDGFRWLLTRASEP